MKSFLRLIGMLKPYLGRFMLALICLLLVTACIVAFTSLVKPIFDEVISNSNFMAGEESVENLELRSSSKEDALTLAVKIFKLDTFLPEWMRQPAVLVPIVLVLIFAVKGVFSYFGNYLMAAVGQGAVRDIRNGLFNSLIIKPISFFRRRATGGLISRVTNDVERIQFAVSTSIADLMREALTVVGLGLLIIYLNWQLAVISLLVAPVILLPVFQFGKRLRATSRSGQEYMEGLATRLHETFSGIRIVKAFSAEEHEKKLFSDENESLLNVNLRATKYFSLTGPVMEIIGAFGVGFIIYWGFTQISTGAMTVGELGVILAALYGMYNPIKRLSRVNNNIQQALAAVERISEIMDLEEEIFESPGAVTMPPFEEKIEFRNVSFSYSDRTILNDISLTVPKGTVCAIVGISGAGKTTLVNLLPRFDDVTSGEILVDGKDSREFTLSSLRDSIGIVTQETILFNGSVRSNIAYGANGSVEFGKVLEAAKAAYADEFIRRMSEGYDTVIGERGVRLSGGEKQRLAIARALLRDPQILILDEATSSLDSESERLVQSALENLMSSRTTFVIAHRLSTVRRADQIIVLDRGSIVERGTHEELLGLNGLYTKLYRLQFPEFFDEQVNNSLRSNHEDTRIDTAEG
ncbi:MAG TPA: ABC transporter transmembrane domain-containing protein [Acidobacteriota bacterium]|nr:ABC transporter transmembrane domain-containing protein [Acidobacteriota bacterium]